MDRGAWRATVHGIARSRIRLRDWHTLKGWEMSWRKKTWTLHRTSWCWQLPDPILEPRPSSGLRFTPPAWAYPLHPFSPLDISESKCVFRAPVEQESPIPGLHSRRWAAGKWAKFHKLHLLFPIPHITTCTYPDPCLPWKNRFPWNPDVKKVGDYCCRGPGKGIHLFIQ